MFRQLTSVAILLLLVATIGLHADETTPSARARGFRPVWTAVGAGAGFGLGVWVGLAKFDDAINSDRKVWTTAIVSAAAGGILGFLLDRHQAKRSNPAAAPSPFAKPAESWREPIYGSNPAALRPPSVATLIGLDRPTRAAGPQ